MISKYSKLAPKEFKSRHDLVGKVVHWALWKKLKFDHTTKWYVHKAESLLDPVTHKSLRYFVMQTDRHIQARRPDLVS